MKCVHNRPKLLTILVVPCYALISVSIAAAQPEVVLTSEYSEAVVKDLDQSFLNKAQWIKQCREAGGLVQSSPLACAIKTTIELYLCEYTKYPDDPAGCVK